MIEQLLKALFKFMGVTDDQAREVFEKGQALIVDGHAQIATMNNRLARIEAHLGIPPEPAAPQLEDHSNGR
jgi:hypothetical protein